MIIATPPFKPSRVAKTFTEAYSKQYKMHLQKTGRLEVLPVESLVMAARAAKVTIATEIALMSLV